MKTPCEHIFHDDCYLKLNQRKEIKCPVCEIKIERYLWPKNKMKNKEKIYIDN
jgi:hypothetical protein